MKKQDKIYIAGHKGLVGSAFMRSLKKSGYEHLIIRASDELDLRNQEMVQQFFEKEKPDIVFIAAAKVGGIHANNTFRAEFLFDNMSIHTNIIHASYLNQVKKLLYLGSSCIYPRMAPQPLKEEYLMTGPLEPTNEPYAIAKIAGIKMCDAYRAQYGCNYISVLPTNLYGPNDHYDLQNSHVLPTLIRKFHVAKKEAKKEVEIWGTGSPMREFLHVDDMAEACMFLMQHYNQEGPVNIGTGLDISIRDLALMIKKITGYHGTLNFNTSMPDGMPRKLLDVQKINNMGWRAKIELEDGIRSVYEGLVNEEWF